MKKLDYLIIIIIILFFLIVSYFVFKTNTSTDKIQIIVNNEIIDEISINDNYEYFIISENDIINIYKNNIIFKTIKYNMFNKQIENHIIVKDNKVIMAESNCSGQDCMQMELNSITKMPIICTNGIVIKFAKKENYQSDINT